MLTTEDIRRNAVLMAERLDTTSARTRSKEVQNIMRWASGNLKELADEVATPGSISDGYHTFDELYQHRNAMFILMANQTGDASFKTKKNSDGEEFPGYFLLGINTPIGQISYHMPIEYWDFARVQEVERNEKYDGNTAKDVYERIMMAVAGSI